MPSVSHGITSFFSVARWFTFPNRDHPLSEDFIPEVIRRMREAFDLVYFILLNASDRSFKCHVLDGPVKTYQASYDLQGEQLRCVILPQWIRRSTICSVRVETTATRKALR